MTDSADGSNVFHSNPVTEAGFTQLPMAVMLRKDLSVGAKLTYGLLKFIAWRAKGDPATPQVEIAEMLNVSERVVRDYLKELREAPVTEGNDDPDAARLVESQRRGLGLPNLYVINDPVLPDFAERNGRIRRSERQDPPVPTRARDRAGKTKGLEAPTANAVVATATPEKPPKLTYVNGRNLAFDTLVEECGIDPGSPRLGDVAVALNGVRGRPGIRALFWLEAQRWAEATGREQIATTDRFETALALAIRAKAMKYREKMPGAILTPTALAKWWLDLERMKSPDGGLTPEEMRNFLA